MGVSGGDDEDALPAGESDGEDGVDEEPGVAGGGVGGQTSCE